MGGECKLSGIAAAGGMAFGKAYVYRPDDDLGVIPALSHNTVEEDLDAYNAALTSVDADLGEISGRLYAAGDKENAKIFEAHREFLQDEEMRDAVLSAITQERLEPAGAVKKVFSDFASMLEKVPDPLIAARAADLRDVSARLMRKLLNIENPSLLNLPKGTVLVARDLFPSDTARLDPACVLGIVTEQGSYTSHTAILSRALGIPAVLGVSDVMSRIQNGAQIAMDGSAGMVYVDPSPEKLANLRERAESYQETKRQNEASRKEPAVTADGVRIEIGINIGGREANFETCDYCGLLRTEFLFLDRNDFPSEEQQFDYYRDVLKKAGGKPVTLRTLDIGGDKFLPYFPLPKEENPFLGKRALRLFLDHPELCRPQLRAALRASAYGELEIMYPMVGSLEDYRKVRALTRDVMQELKDEGISFNPQTALGIMIEIPSIAEIADFAASEVDFASIGTNDLCQYLCAADRMNPSVAQNYQSFSPAMLRCLYRVSTAFRSAGKPLSICGELGGDARATKLLIGLGFRKLSMNEASISAVKAEVRRTSVPEAEALAKEALKCLTEGEVLDLLKSQAL